MKGETTLKILEYIGDFSVGLTDLTAAFLSSGYGASTNKIMYEFDKRGRERSKRRADRLELQKQKKRLSSMLYRLRSDGLIEKKSGKNKSRIKLTPKGRQRFEELKKRRADALPNHSYIHHEQNEKNKKFAIVIFDIPERERRKRAWLRSALKNIGFKLIQKSVWAGKVKIPKEFLDDLKDLRIIEHVEIFEISKSGSLQQLI